MAQVFAITAVSTSVRTDAQGKGEASFTVSNVSGRPLRGRATAKADAPGRQGWLALVGEPEREFPPGGTHKFTVTITLPPGTAPGKYGFGLDVASPQNPDEDFAEGPRVTIEVETTKAPAKRPFPWWILAAAGAVIVVVGSVTTYLLLREKTTDTAAPTTSAAATPSVTPPATKPAATAAATAPATAPATPAAPPAVSADGGAEIPDLIGVSQTDAEAQLKAARFVIGTVTRRLSEHPDGAVIEQAPRRQAGVFMPAGSVVELVVADGGVKVPNVVGFNLAAARSTLATAKLKPREVEVKSYDGTAQDTILGQKPGRDELVRLGTEVEVSVATALVRVPPLVGTVRGSAVSKLTDSRLGFRESYRDATSSAQDTVLEQSPPPQTEVKPGTQVSLVLANYVIPVPSVVGASRNDAFNALGAKQLVARETERRERVNTAQDTVLEQTPRPGTAVKAGASVALVVADAACPPKFENLGNDYAFIYLDLPQTKVGTTISFRDVSVAIYKFPRCYHVGIKDNYRYTCNATPRGGVWAQAGTVYRDAGCVSDGDRNQTFMKTETK